jgi:hypothetical protein
MTNLIKFGDLKHTYRSTFLLFFYSSEYKIFGIYILHVCGIIHELHPKKKFNFCKTHRYGFEFFELTRSTGAREHEICVPHLYL